ncbi:hypothetical protein [Microaceticoccus formicicus]|uniref:hypothetical protein n=1 Tax=Microaceticoccus formicicus TaxID=3118105 RepID=UPI003CD01FE6|nr:hypothetical protein VZL98_04870 [Peptoniphilaceae bacterium AMB_02]
MAYEGWIKIHRKILEDATVMRDPEHFTIWMFLLLNATHTQMEKYFKGEKIILQPGQLITGRKSISKQCNISESKIQRILKLFESEQQIEQQTTNLNRLITILRWNEYQQSEQQSEQPVNNKSNFLSCSEDEIKKTPKSEQQMNSHDTVTPSDTEDSTINSEQPVNNQRTTSEQPVNTNKNVKNVNNDKNDKNIINSITLDRPTGADPANHNASVDDDSCFEIIKTRFEVDIKNEPADPRDYVSITSAIRDYPAEFILQTIQSLVDRGVKNIKSFNYVAKVLESAWEEKNKQARKKKNIIKHEETTIDGENFDDLLKRKQKEFLQNHLEGLSERTGDTESN